MSNVLAVLSPHFPDLFNKKAAIDMALAFRAMGVTRIDITVDPRHKTSTESSHAVRYPVLNFALSAKEISESILRPMIGQSSVRDLSVPISRQTTEPSLATLSNVGRLFCTQEPSQGAKIGMLFYAALFAKSPDDKAYSRLLIPDATTSSLSTLRDRFGLKADDFTLDTYGTVINLDRTRKVLQSMAMTQQQPQPRRLH